MLRRSQCSGLINSVPLVHLSGKWIVTHSDQALLVVLPQALIALHIKLFISTSRGLRPHLGSNYKAARGSGVCHASEAVIYQFCLHLESELSLHFFPSSCASRLKASISSNSLLYYLCEIDWAAVKNQILSLILNIAGAASLPRVWGLLFVCLLVFLLLFPSILLLL